MPSLSSTNPILLGPRALLGSLISFEALLVLYMFAGVYKGDTRFAWVPIDLTGLFFALSVVVGSFIIVRNPIHKKALPVVFAMVCLVTWMWVTLAWSPSRVYGPDKVFFMATLELWAVIAGAMIIAPDPERVRRLFSLIVLFSVWVGIEALLAYMETGGQGFISVGSAGYLMVGRICGMGALIALAGWLYSGTRTARWLCLGLFFCFGLLLVVGGGRGPLLATALPLLIPVGFGIRLTKRKVLYSRTLLSVLALLLGMVSAVGLYIASTGEVPQTLQRLDRLVTGFGGELTGSEGQRADLYAEASEIVSRAPLLGHGAGSWPLLTGRPDQRDYPHNLLAELLAEGGLVALVLFGAVVGAALRQASFERLRRDPQALCAVILFVNALSNAMVSGDLPDNRAMFMVLGLLALLAVRRPKGAAVPTTTRDETFKAAALSWLVSDSRRQLRAAASGRVDGRANTQP